MAETVVLVTQPRQGRGSHKAAHLRKSGQVPAVLYGHKEATVSLSVSEEALRSAIRHGARIVDLQLEGHGLETARIREVQYDYLGKEILHVDLQRTSKDELIEVDIKIDVRGIAPGVTGGGVLDQPLHTLKVRCKATSVPDSIRVNINELQLGQAIHVRELHLPEGVEALANAEAIVIHVTEPAKEPEPGAIPGVGEMAEPERIVKQRATEDEGDKK
jgi:large subunit ribosomal protein L25